MQCIWRLNQCLLSSLRLNQYFSTLLLYYIDRGHYLPQLSLFHSLEEQQLKVLYDNWKLVSRRKSTYSLGKTCILCWLFSLILKWHFNCNNTTPMTSTINFRDPGLSACSSAHTVWKWWMESVSARPFPPSILINWKEVMVAFLLLCVLFVISLKEEWLCCKLNRRKRIGLLPIPRKAFI